MRLTRQQTRKALRANNHTASRAAKVAAKKKLGISGKRFRAIEANIRRMLIEMWRAD